MKHKCIKCDAMATWHYMPDCSWAEEERYFCDNHVDRGCSCNIIDDIENTDEQGRLLPCCEYFEDNDGFYMRYNLWIDDQALDPDLPKRHAPSGWKVATTISEAIKIVEENHLPEIIDFDHDLGVIDGVTQEVTTFIHWMIEHYRDEFVPAYKVHSANPLAKDNITSLMESWKKVSELEKIR